MVLDTSWSQKVIIWVHFLPFWGCLATFGYFPKIPNDKTEWLMLWALFPASGIKSRFCFRRNYSSNFGQKNRDLFCTSAFQVVLVKNLPASAGDVRDSVQSLGQEDHLKEAWQPQALAWRIPRTEEPGRLQSLGLQRVERNWSDLHTPCYFSRPKIIVFLVLLLLLRETWWDMQC